MPWTTTWSPDVPDMVFVTYSGVITPPELREASAAAVRLGHEHHVMRYLADTTAVTRLPRELEIFALPAAMYDELGLERSELRVAVVVPAAGEVREMARFYETASLNRGWRVKVFDATGAALTWLGVESRAV